MKMPRVLKPIAVSLLAVSALLVLVVVFFDWNWLRGPIARQVSSATGRTFAINGDLKVHLSLRPRIVAHELVFGNAAWSSDRSMAEIKRVDFRIDLLQLLAGRVEVPELALSEPQVWLEVGPDGTPNWVFNGQDKDKPLEFPTITALTIDQGSATYRDPALKTSLVLAVKTLDDGKDNRGYSLEVSGKGRYNGLPAVVHARGGALLSLRSTDDPYPIKANVTLGTTKASVDGMLLDPLHLRGQQLNFQIEGSDLALLFPIIGVPIPPSPPYKLAGYLDHAGDVWTFRRFKGKVGQSDLAGDFVVDRGKQPQMITANLVSRTLDMKDLGGFIGAERGTQSGKPAPDSGKLLPSEPFDFEKLQATNADVKFRAEKILTGKLPLDNMRAHLLLKNGTLKLAPLDFGIAGGNLVSQIEMDVRKPRIVTRADMAATGLRLERLLPASKLPGAETGTLTGHAKLEGKGQSVAQMLATANGHAALIMEGGSVGELMLRLSNLDVANSLVVLLGGDKPVSIDCMVGRFKAVDGIFNIETLLLDTPKVNVAGSGDVNFAEESLHIRLVSQAKGFSLVSLRGPIAVTGSFANPVVRPEAGKAVARGGLALALGAATGGLGALIPLFDFGRDQDSSCNALMTQAKSDAGMKAGEP